MYIVHRTNIKISIFWILGKDICVQFVIEVQINFAKYVVWPDPKDLRTSVDGVDRLICLLGRDSGRWEGRKTRRWREGTIKETVRGELGGRKPLLLLFLLFCNWSKDSSHRSLFLLGNTSHKKSFLLRIAQINAPSPQFGQVVQLFWDVKNDVLTHITETSNDDYDEDWSDNCDYNFGTFDDFGVKNDQKVYT